MISIRNLKKSYGDSVILDNVNLDIEKGETVVIIGASGCGKSTLLRCINRLNEPDSGEILIDGENILARDADVDRIRRKMGMVYQNFNLFSHLNVLENVILAPMKVLGIDEQTAIKEAEELLGQVGMLMYKNNMPNTLSGGQKQRVAIARALAMHPDVMLFDEPTSALDPTMVDEVENVIKKLVAGGMTSIIVTHEMRFAKSVASRVVFLAEKGVYESGTTREVFDNPKKSLTRRFLYRSRMYEQSFKRDQFDPYKLRAEMTMLIAGYEHTSKQIRAFSSLCDELLYPVFEAAPESDPNVTVRLVCSETSSDHLLVVNYEGLDRSPLELIDELNAAILNAVCKSMTPVKCENGWEVVMEL